MTKKENLSVTFGLFIALMCMYFYLHHTPKLKSEGKVIVTLDNEQKIVVLNADKNAINTTHLRYSIKGNIEGEAILQSHKKYTIHDGFELKYDNDWYTEEVKFEVIPIQMSSGNFEIEYCFYSEKLSLWSQFKKEILEEKLLSNH